MGSVPNHIIIHKFYISGPNFPIKLTNKYNMDRASLLLYQYIQFPWDLLFVSIGGGGGYYISYFT